MALLMIVLTGFAAVTIDAGLGYMQSRSDQDVSDGVALAVSYQISADGTPLTSDDLTGLLTEAQGLATLDGCTGSCAVPYLELWTTAYTSGSSPSYYLKSGPVCPTSASGTTGACPTTVDDVGAPVSDQGTEYFANLGSSGTRTYTIATSAVAEVPTGGSGSGSGISFPCDLCVLDTLDATNNLDSVAGLGDFDVNNKLEQSGSTCIVTSTNGGINLPPSSDVSIGTGHGCNYSAHTGPSPKYESAAGWMSTKWPSTGSWPAGDPLSGARLGSFTSYTAGQYCSSNCSQQSNWSSVSQTSDWSAPGDGTFEFSPGTYYGISTSASASAPVILDFEPGVYIFYGDGVNIGGGTVTLQNAGSGGVTFYFTCQTGSKHTGYTPSNCSSGTSGATFYVSAANASIDLSAPTSGAEGNMLFWYDPYNKATLTFDGNLNTDSMDGAIYLASGTLSGSPSDDSGCGLPGPIIAKEITLGGGCNLSLDGTLEVQATPATPGNLVS